MRTGTVCLLLTILGLAGAARGQDPKPGEAPPEETIRVHPDGSVSSGGMLTRFWQVNHQNPQDIQKEIEKFLGVKADSGIDMMVKGKNILRIEAPEEKWPIIEKLIDSVDVQEPQVYVDARIIEIRYDNNLEFGFDAAYDRRKADGGAKTFFGKFTGTFNPETYLEAIGTSKPYQGGTFEFQNSPDSVSKHGEFSYILRALQERGSAEILSQPSIIALQGQTASILTGVEFPVQTVDVRGNQTTIVTKFEKTGISLKITPELVGREYVKVKLVAEDRQITERIPGPSGSLVPVISSRTADTTVSVRDGETIIIGGLLTSTTIESRTGLPLLSDIPILGYLFSSTRSQEVKSELLFFVTPRIIKRNEQTIISPPSEKIRLRE